MNSVRPYIPDLLRLVRQKFPDWDSFTHPPFVDDEIRYKREASDSAKALLSKEVLQKLLAEEDYEEFIAHLKSSKVVTNLLWTNIPREGDLALISQPDVDNGLVCRAVYDLLYGHKTTLDRLGDFLAFIQNNKLPQKWTFPTYYLFLLYPETEIYIKPRVVRWLARTFGGPFSYSSKPSAAQYASMRDTFKALGEELRVYGAQDMIDVQSFVWVAVAAGKKGNRPSMEGENAGRTVEVRERNNFSHGDEQMTAEKFTGFTDDAFRFIKELADNNTKEWMDENRERYHASVREPMSALFADLGPQLKPKFDPYLTPDELEIDQQLLGRIYKNWAATPESMYYEYFWGAFYRSRLKRQTDAQLAIIVYVDRVSFGFYLGERTKQIPERFRRRVLEDAPDFYRLISELGIENGFDFVSTNDVGEPVTQEIRTPADLRKWVEGDDPNLLQSLSAEEVIDLGPLLADRIYHAFRRVFPVYLWAVADDPERTTERYLQSEFAVVDEDLDEEPESAPEPYTKADFLSDTYLTGDKAAELEEMLADRKQVILFGPPGTGKTYVALHLGKLLTGLADPPEERLEIIQFHQAYSYEDFIEGIRPKSRHEDGRYIIDYPPTSGVFVDFCRRAQSIDGPCVFIIDEINRGNIPRIFGELMLLLEYRDLDVPLPYSKERFRIPKNVYIIGTMNTADRSIALVDFALRRRFHFFRFAADSALFDRWLAANPSQVRYLSALYRRLSQEAIDDPHYAIGPSYFMRNDLSESRLESIWNRSILPYLEEYYFDQLSKAKRWEWDSDFMQTIREESDV